MTHFNPLCLSRASLAEDQETNATELQEITTFLNRVTGSKVMRDAYAYLRSEDLVPGGNLDWADAEWIRGPLRGHDDIGRPGVGHPQGVFVVFS
jgi:hypothetical protein